jgi:hypothetical protein
MEIVFHALLQAEATIRPARPAMTKMRICTTRRTDSPASTAVTITSSVTSFETRVTSVNTPLMTMTPL